MEQKLIRTVAATLDVDPSVLSLQTAGSDIEEWDSLAHLNLVSAVEEEFGVEIPIEEIAGIEKIGDFLGYLGG